MRYPAFVLSALVALLLFLAAPTANATSIILSDMSSDDTPFEQLDAVFDFSTPVGGQITLRVTNTTSGEATFNINEIYFNKDPLQPGLFLDLVSATHSAAGDVTAAWGGPGLVSGGSGSGMFGTFDFALTDGVGFENPNLIGPAEYIDFLFNTNATDMGDFAHQNEAEKFASAKFVNCRGTDCMDDGFDDSAFGAQGDPSFVLPEPTTALLLGLGIAGLAASARRRRV